MNKYLEQRSFAIASLKSITALTLAVLWSCASQLSPRQPTLKLFILMNDNESQSMTPGLAKVFKNPRDMDHRKQRKDSLGQLFDCP